MIEIHKNGTGSPVVNVMDIIKVFLIIVGGLVFYFQGFGGLERTLVNHDTRIEDNEDDIRRHEGKIEKLGDTKVDKE